MTEFSATGETSYLALIGDLRGSRQRTDRAQLQMRMLASAAAIVDALGEDVVTRPALLRGDEIQCLLRRPAAALDAVLRIEAHLLPRDLRFGLGWGPLSTDLGPQVLALDGPCFHRARHALDEARRRKVWMRVEGLGDDRDATLDGIFHLLGSVRWGWTEAQAETVALLRRLSVRKEVAARRKVTPSTVTKALDGARYDAVAAAEAAARRLLEAEV
jgi:hypothetical protein